jgi:diaminopimelate decarboxylase
VIPDIKDSGHRNEPVNIRPATVNTSYSVCSFGPARADRCDMTLADLLPSLRTFAAPAVSPLVRLAAEHGTPLHVLDEAVVRARCAAYAHAFGTVSYSAKAGLNIGLGRWIASSGLGCYVGGRTALRTALVSGFDPSRCTMSGAGKSLEDLDAAFACGAAVVAHSPAEVAMLADRAPHGQAVLLRVVPSAGVRRKSCFPLGAGTTRDAVARIRRARNLVFAGFDLAVGHRLNRFGTFEAHVREAAAFCAVVRGPVPLLNLGGGYSDDFATEPFAARIRGVLALAADRYRIPPPRLSVSPGRALVEPAGTTIGRMLDPNTVDAADCACGSAHAATLLGRTSHAPLRPLTLAELPVVLPADLATGDLVAFSATGAYHPGTDRAAVVSSTGDVLVPRREPF